MLWSLPALWVNHPARQADLYKPLQLAVAARCGLTVPDTLTTNRPERVQAFAAAHPGGTVIKPLGFSSTTEGDRNAMIYTHLLTVDDLSDLSGVEQMMHTFQAYIEKAYEVRLTVVGRRMLAARIDATGQAAQIDFRSDYSSLRFSVIPEVPESVSAGVSAFLDYFGLAFGAFDFIVDRSDTWWMLECNGGGQYAFVEQETGLPISAAVADLLEKGSL